MTTQPTADAARPVNSKSVDDLTHRNLRMILEQERAARSGHSHGERLASILTWRRLSR